jgi:hypothetical protein
MWGKARDSMRGRFSLYNFQYILVVINIQNIPERMRQHSYLDESIFLEIATVRLPDSLCLYGTGLTAKLAMTLRHYQDSDERRESEHVIISKVRLFRMG